MYMYTVLNRKCTLGLISVCKTWKFEKTGPFSDSFVMCVHFGFKSVLRYLEVFYCYDFTRNFLCVLSFIG